MLKIEPGNEALTDGRTDGQTDGRQTDRQTDTRMQIFCGGYNIIPSTFLKWRGIKRETTLTEWAPSPLNLPERENTGSLNFHIQTTYQISRS